MTGIPKEFWDSRFAEQGFAYGDRASRLLMAFRDLLKPGMSAFVPGAGEGRDAVFLAKCGLDVLAVDLSPVGLGKAVSLAEREGVKITTEAADLMDWNWPEGRFDVLAAMFLHVPPDIRPGVHRRMLAALKPGGFLFLEGFTPEQLTFQERFNSGGPPVKEMLFAPEDVGGDFADAVPFSFWTGTEVLEEGPYHSGPAALIRAVYRRPEN